MAKLQSKPSLKTLRDQSKALELELQIIQQQQALSALRQTPLMEAWGDFVAPPGIPWEEGLGAGYGQPLSGGLSTVGGLLGDRADGRNRPFWETESQLAIIRAKSRWLATLDCTGVGILERLTNYVIGSGYKFSASKKKNANVTTGLAEAVQAIIDEFLEENDFCGIRDREIFNNSRRDGDLLINSFHLGDGHTQIRLAGGEQIVQPPEGQQIADHYDLGHIPLDWMFGIATDASDVEKIYGFHIVWKPGNWQDYSFITPEFGDECATYLKLNSDSNIKRGVSDFYPAFIWLERAAKVAGNTATGAALQAAIAYVVEMVQGVTQSQITAAQSGKTDALGFQPQQGGSSRPVAYQKFEGGTIVRTPKGQQYKPGPMGAERINGFVEVYNMALRIVGQRWDMPEFMISGDASRGNRASTVVAESPFVKACEAKQNFYKIKFLRLVHVALFNAITAGRLSEYGIPSGPMAMQGLKVLKAQVHVDAEPPSLVTRDPKTETQQRAILSEAGILSDRTWASQEGLDFDQEVSDGAKKMPGAKAAIAKTVDHADPANSSSSFEASPAGRLSAASRWRGYP